MVRLSLSSRALMPLIGIMCLLLSVASTAEELPLFVPQQEEPIPATDDTSAEPAADIGPAPEEKPMLLRKAEETHLRFSTRLERIARNLDNFFAAEQAFEGATRSYARVRLDTILDNDIQLGFNGDIRVKIDLPRTERKLKLLIESDGRNATPDRPEQTPIDVVKQQDYLLSIERVAGLEKWDVRPAAGIKVRWVPDPFVRLRAVRYRNLDGWLIRNAANVFWFTSDGLGANAAVDFDRQIGDVFLFRSTSTLRWEENDQFLSADQQLSLYQRLDARRYLVYQAGILADQNPEWSEKQYFFAVRYRKNVYKNWLFMEVIPQINFTRENQFDGLPSVMFRLEGVFGYDYL